VILSPAIFVARALVPAWRVAAHWTGLIPDKVIHWLTPVVGRLISAHRSVLMTDLLMWRTVVLTGLVVTVALLAIVTALRERR
jgi:hypothetical protein